MALVQLLLLFSLFLIHGVLGEIVCEELPVGLCSFSVASSGKRCLLETSPTTPTRENDDRENYQCKTSEIMANNMPEWIESDECIDACGLDRYAVGISSDSLLDSHFMTSSLCSTICYEGCPNIVHLYYNLALAEGLMLDGVCKAQQINPRREMVQILSSGQPLSTKVVAAGPASISIALDVACAPTSI
ncbi:uncharacterized protein LOC124943436 [Impatiens glandulifera]|uniref:uncharacterized protein LOC124943436 n=1 Tax=Impatiens glandulifera TaxID=253017 RepID=UPI001FB12608|nr:uncharacterized protein LOC124943436 [Impatiens glandulifera]